jgi:F-type H+-transporting ATPase subunit b
MRVNWFTFFAQILNFLVLVALLKRFLFTPVLEAIRQRDFGISERELLAKERENDASIKERDWELRLAHIESERAEILRTAVAHGETEQARLHSETRRELTALRSSVMGSIEAEERAIRNDLLLQIGKFATEMASEIVREWGGAELNEHVVKSFCSRLEKWRNENLSALEFPFENGENPLIIVRTFSEIEETHRIAIANAIRTTFPAAGEIQFELDASLGFGIAAFIGAREFSLSAQRYFSHLNEYLESFWRSQQSAAHTGETYERDSHETGATENPM